MERAVIFRRWSILRERETEREREREERERRERKRGERESTKQLFQPWGDLGTSVELESRVIPCTLYSSVAYTTTQPYMKQGFISLGVQSIQKEFIYYRYILFRLYYYYYRLYYLVGLGRSVGWTPAGLTYVFAKGVSDQVRDPLTPRNSLQ